MEEGAGCRVKKRLGHNDIAAVCRAVLIGRGVINLTMWDSDIYDFASGMAGADDSDRVARLYRDHLEGLDNQGKRQ